MKVGVNVITVVFFAAVPANSEALFFSFEVGAELNCDCHPLVADNWEGITGEGEPQADFGEQ